MVRIKVLQDHLPSVQVIWSILLQLILISVVFLLVLIYDLLKDRRIDNVTINQISPSSLYKTNSFHMLPAWVCSGMDHSRLQNVVRNISGILRLSLVRHVFVLSKSIC